jgi:glycerol-3-phosphate acyltransferase PlsX
MIKVGGVRVKIVLDCMGNDNGPEVMVEGAKQAMSVNDDLNIIFVGNKEKIDKLLKDSYKDRITVINATEEITNNESPVKAIRTKKDASLVKGMNLLKEGKGDAIISAGSTGALLAGAVFIVGRLKGIQRAALTTVYPTKNKPSLLLDIGANVDCKPEFLEQFAIMGSVYADKILNRKNPKIGLANIGAEAKKGNSLVKEAYDKLIDLDNINFIGNIEVRDLMKGEVDVIVCDGFVGNVILKTTEGTALTIFDLLKETFLSKTIYKIGALLLKSGLKTFKRKFDYSEYGAAPLLGVKAPVFKAHGSSNSKSIKNAILCAVDYLNKDIINTIQKEIEREEK